MSYSFHKLCMRIDSIKPSSPHFLYLLVIQLLYISQALLQLGGGHVTDSDQ